MINPMLIPSRKWIAARRAIVVLCCAFLGPLLIIEGEAANSPNAVSPSARTPVQNPRTQTATSQTQVQRPEGKLVLVRPGTVIGKEAPAKWSHLILKSLPRIAPQHRNLVSESTYRLSSMVFTAILAKVEPIPGANPQRYILGDIGLGLGTKVRGQDMVLSPETQAQLGANLGIQERIVLSECYKRQAMARQIVRTNTMALVDTHAVIRQNGQHRLAKVRYAVLLDPRSGQIATLTWGVDVDQNGQPRTAITHLEWLTKNRVTDCLLFVDRRHFTLGIPGNLAFAVDGAPRGHSRIPLTQELSTLAGQPRYTPQMAGQLETTLRQELSQIIQQATQRESASRVAGSPGQR
ncbi:MAG: hypothetical protein KDA84_11285 [Planctomycetaceae bacterium]|nr:hypothetical protein [Planctomycetaceae bacterium]